MNHFTRKQLLPLAIFAALTAMSLGACTSKDSDTQRAPTPVNSKPIDALPENPIEGPLSKVVLAIESKLTKGVMFEKFQEPETEPIYLVDFEAEILGASLPIENLSGDITEGFQLGSFNLEIQPVGDCGLEVAMSSIIVKNKGTLIRGSLTLSPTTEEESTACDALEKNAGSVDLVLKLTDFDSRFEKKIEADEVVVVLRK